MPREACDERQALAEGEDGQRERAYLAGDDHAQEAGKHDRKRRPVLRVGDHTSVESSSTASPSLMRSATTTGTARATGTPVYCRTHTA